MRSIRRATALDHLRGFEHLVGPCQCEQTKNCWNGLALFMCRLKCLTQSQDFLHACCCTQPESLSLAYHSIAKHQAKWLAPCYI